MDEEEDSAVVSRLCSGREKFLCSSLSLIIFLSLGALATALDRSGNSPQDLVPEGPDDEDIIEALDKASGRKGGKAQAAAAIGARKQASKPSPPPPEEEPFEKKFAKLTRDEQLRKVWG